MRPASSLALSALVLGIASSSFARPITVHLIGDSTMAEKPTPEVNPERGWGMAFQQFFDDSVVVRNHALNGRSTKSFIAEGHWATVLSDLRTGDYLFIEFGHNDEKSEDSTRYAPANTDFARNLERFVREARAKGATPVLLTPIVRRKFDGRGQLVETHGLYPAAVRSVAARLSVPLIDLNTLTHTLVGDAGPVESKRLYVYVDPGTSVMYPTGRQDDTHLSVRGATAVARLAAAALARTPMPLARHVRLDRPLPAPIFLWSARAPDGRLSVLSPPPR
jgi:lysophospholipase L1-like esterase